VNEPAITFAAFKARDLAEAARGRLVKRVGEVAGLPDLERPKRWLSDAEALLAGELESLGKLLRLAEKLAELEGKRDLFARTPQHAWVDALERLWAAVSFHMGRRAPLLEALFPHTKFPLLRKPKAAVVREYQGQLQKKLASTYVQRILSDPDSAFALPLVAQAEAAFASWEDTLTGPSLEEAPAATLRRQLFIATKKLEGVQRQAKLLLEASNLALPAAEVELPPAPPEA
jgi:hypothetical protein